MRLWSIHPKYLDSKGLVALWCESLLAQAVLHDNTVGYRDHPALDCFKNHESTKEIMYEYLQSIFQELQHRNFRCDWSRVFEVSSRCELPRMPVVPDQIEFEWNLLSMKLQTRDRAVYPKKS